MLLAMTRHLLAIAPLRKSAFSPLGEFVCYYREQTKLTRLSRTCSQCPTIQCIAKSSSSGGSSVNVGAIVGPIVAALVIASLGLFWWMRRKKVSYNDDSLRSVLTKAAEKRSQACRRTGRASTQSRISRFPTLPDRFSSSWFCPLSFSQPSRSPTSAFFSHSSVTITPGTCQCRIL